MGYRDRRQYRAQQQQQALGQTVQAEQRETVPAPTNMNLRDGVDLGASDAPYLLNAIGTDNGLRLLKERQTRVYVLPPRFTAPNLTLVTYDASGSASSEAWLVYRAASTSGITIADIGAVIATGATATAGFTTAPITGIGGGDTAGTWEQFDKTIIYAADANGMMKWNRASGWEFYSISVSGPTNGKGGALWGVTKFKNRMYAWWQASAAFAYGSVDQYTGDLVVLENFPMGTVLGEDVMFCTSMTRDGGSGPDDFFVIVGVTGKVVVYQGSNPGDASDWALVGVYQIGRPVSKNGHVKYGGQVHVLCHDDIYVLPDDLIGQRQAKHYQHTIKKQSDTFYGSKDAHMLNAIYDLQRGWLVWGDGTVLNTKRGFEFSQIQYAGFEPYVGYETSADKTSVSHYAALASYKGKILAAHATTSEVAITELDPKSGSKYSNNKIYTGRLPTKGRTNISLVNPVFRKRNERFISTTTSTPQSLTYRIAGVFDQELRYNSSVDSAIWQTASANLSGTFGEWLPLFGTGDQPQVALEVLSASTSAEFVFTKINLTISDTGGL